MLHRHGIKSFNLALSTALSIQFTCFQNRFP